MAHLISYAQNFEDIMLWRALARVEGGCYIDVGAQSPHVDSVSKVFYEHGWRGIHVEPMAMYAEELRRARPDETVIQAAVSSVAGVVPFFEFADTGLSTTDPGISARHVDAGFAGQGSTVAAITLDDVLDRAGGPDVHWMKIDIEGGEYNAIRGWKGDSVLPWIVIVESTLPLTAEEAYGDWEPLLLGKGYRFAYFDGLNRFYVSPRHPELLDAFKAGPNLFDGFALSGSANAPFCSAVNEQMKQLRDETAAALEAASQQRAQVEAEADERIAGLQAANALLERTSTAERAAREQRERELSGQVADGLQRELALSGQLAEGLQRELALSKGMNEALQGEVHARVELDTLRKDFHQLRDELQLARSQLHSHQEAAHRWWQTAEGLRRDLDEVLGSHSWRVTAPLRNSRRAASAVHAGVRKGLRGILVGAMRGAIKVPLLRRPAGAVLGLSPPLRRRLRGIAGSAGLIEGDAPPAPRLTDKGAAGGDASRPRPQGQPVLSRRARMVLADLKQSIEESPN